MFMIKMLGPVDCQEYRLSSISLLLPTVVPSDIFTEPLAAKGILLVTFHGGLPW